MASNNSKYSQEAREETAKFIIESGKSATSVGEEMGIDKNTVCRWVRDYRRKYNLPSSSYAEEKGVSEKNLVVKSALGNAISRVNNTEGIIFHSDRGSQYRSKGYKNMLDENKIISSMSKPVCPYDNSCVDSFFATLKKECIYRKSYATIEEIRHDVFEYIELFYNGKRMHSVLGYMSPVEYRLIKYS